MLPLTNLRYPVSHTSSENPPDSSGQEGLALLIAVIALSLFSLLGLYVSLNATTEVRISENYESRQQARLAATAGLNHARELIRGLELNDLLRGPDGVGTSTYPSTTSGKYAFRNSVDWSTARSLSILDPTSAVSGLPDDGLFNTGKYDTTDGTVLVPATGVALTAPNPYGSGTVITARYFLKVTDNDDGDNNPFADRDGIVIVRSTGVAQTIRETAGGTVRANSVAVYESRFRRLKTFRLNLPLIIEGDNVLPADSNMFNGGSFLLDGGTNPYGIGTIDTNTSDTLHPAPIINAALDPKQYNQVKGQCCVPAIGDITSSLSGDQLLLLDPSYVWDLAYHVMPSFADNVFQGNQKWTATTPLPDIGYYDPSKPMNDQSQRPRVTYVNGDLEIGSNLSGAGIMFVTGNLKITGNLKWSGMLLVVGQGSVNIHGGSASIDAGMLVANLQAGSPPTFGTPQITIAGNSNFQVKQASLEMTVDQYPVREISRREVTNPMDP
jgi:hypothetical protein